MLKKFFTVILAAVCVLSAASTAVYGQSVSCCREECASLADSGFEQNYIDLAIKYHGKKTDKTVSYKKSRSKKFLDKFNKTVMSKKPEYTLELSDRHSLAYVARKDGKMKCIYHDRYLYDCYSEVVYADGDSVTAFSVESKTKAKLPKDKVGDTLADNISEEGLLFDDINGTGKYFKFKSGGKIYYYEEFGVDESPSSPSQPSYLGFLFDEGGDVLAVVYDDEAYYMSFKTAADDSEFTQPKGYKTVDYEDFDY